MGIGRRQLLTFLGTAMLLGTVAPALAQSSGQVAKIGFLMGLADDAEARGRAKTFEAALQEEGWSVGKDVKIEYRFAAGDAKRMEAFAKELAAQKPDVIVAHSTPVVREVLKVSSAIPVVFVSVADPVGSGFTKSIARPDTNATGFTVLDSGITGKMLTILKQIAPNLKAAALMFNPDTVSMGGLFYSSSFEKAAPAFGTKPITKEVRSPADIEKAMADLGAQPDVGLIVMPDNFTTVNRQMIVELANKWKIPAIYPYRYFAEGGGLMSYGVDVNDLFRRAPEYVSRILKGAKPGDLPVQAPTKFELVINLKTATALGLTVPKILLAGAEALIE